MSDEDSYMMDADDLVDHFITLQINSGLFTNFLGCLVSGSLDPEFILGMVYHFLNSLATGTHQSLVAFNIVSIDLKPIEQLYQLVVQVKNGPTPDVWQTHIIRCKGDLIVEDGELVQLSGDED